MKRRPPDAGHLDAPTALDYLDGRLDESGRRDVEAHLASPCPACRERLRALGALTHALRLDRASAVPGALRERALAAFAPAPAAAPAGGVAGLVRLVFDSLRDPLPALARRAVGEARRLRFTLGDGAFELECEAAEAGLVVMRGRLGGPEAALHRIEVRVGDEARSAWPDAGGSFALEAVPAGTVQIAVIGPAGRFELPPLTL